LKEEKSLKEISEPLATSRGRKTPFSSRKSVRQGRKKTTATRKQRDRGGVLFAGRASKRNGEFILLEGGNSVHFLEENEIPSIESIERASLRVEEEEKKGDQQHNVVGERSDKRKTRRASSSSLVRALFKKSRSEGKPDVTRRQSTQRGGVHERLTR